MRQRNKAEVHKLARFAMKRWFNARHRLNCLSLVRDHELDRVRALRSEQRWFAAVERALRAERIAA